MNHGLLAAILQQAANSGGPPSAFPQILATSTYGEGVGASASHSVQLPSGIAPGNLLVMFTRIGGSTMSYTAPSGWALLPGYSAGFMGGFYRFADGSEESDVIVYLGGNTRKMLAVTLRLSPASGIAGIMTNSNTSDPLSLSPSWGIDNTLWFAAWSTRYDNSSAEMIAVPTGFTLGHYIRSTPTGGSTSDAQLAVAWKESATATLNPDAFATVGTLVVPRAATIAIQP